jgi:hypothetical protein
VRGDGRDLSTIEVGETVSNHNGNLSVFIIYDSIASSKSL